jgi:magnesium transporter
MVVQRQVFDRVVERLEELPAVEEDLGPYYDDISDHLWRAVDDIDSARHTLEAMLDHYTNLVQERLTIIATIFLPLSLVTSFFGQNFNWLINHIGSAWTFWGLGIGGLLVSVLVIVLWLAHSGMYSPRWTRPSGRS